MWLLTTFAYPKIASVSVSAYADSECWRLLFACIFIHTCYYIFLASHDYFVYQICMFTTHMKYIFDYCELYFVKNE